MEFESASALATVKKSDSFQNIKSLIGISHL